MLCVIALKRNERSARCRAVPFVVGNAMRIVVAGLVVAGLVSVGAGGAVWMRNSASPPEKIQTAEKTPAPAAPVAPAAQLAAKADALADVTGTVPAPEAKPAPSPAKRACVNPNALGI